MNVNDKLEDDLIGQLVRVDRFEEHLINDVLHLLKDMYTDVQDQLKLIDPSEPKRETFKQLRLKKLEKEINLLIKQYYRDINSLTESELKKLAALESEFVVGSINNAVGVEIAAITLNQQEINIIVKESLVEGAVMKEWFAEQAVDFGKKFNRELGIGVSLGENLNDLINRVKDLIPANNNNAKTVVRTAAQTVSNNARLATYEENDDLIKGVKWLSTLDARTSDICKSLSGLQWGIRDYEPIGHTKKFQTPPAHWNCRSTLTPILKSYDELRGREQRQIPESTQSSMDGQVSDNLNYESWLKRKTVSFQKEVLGETKYNLWKDGKITFTDLTNNSGRPLSIDEIKDQIRG